MRIVPTTILRFSQELGKCPLSFSNTYTVAVKSVILPSVPPSPQYVRSEIICAGFLIHAIDSSSCTVSLMKHLQVTLFLQIWEVFYSYFLIIILQCVSIPGESCHPFRSIPGPQKSRINSLPYTNKTQFSAWKSSMSIRNWNTVFFFLKQVSYFNQISASILPYFAGNLGGWSKSIEETAGSCIRFIENATDDGSISIF